MQPTIQTFESSSVKLLSTFRTGFSFFGLLAALNPCAVGGVNFLFLLLGVALGNRQVKACWFSIIISELQWFLVLALFSLSPTLISSEWFPVAKRILNPTYHLASVWSWQTCQAWPGMMLLAEMMLCLILGSSFVFFCFCFFA